MKLSKKDKKLVGRGYAWKCDFGMCHWAEPESSRLKLKNKPSPEAVIVQVRLVPESIYRRLTK